MRGLYEIYKSQDTRAKPECQGFMNRVQTERWFNVFPANTFFNDAYQTISDIQFIATGRVAPVTGYKYIYICVQKIERTRDLIYLKFVATGFFPKIISPSVVT